MSVGHYENFPVASVLCPPRLRPAIRAIYRFARTADDLADEGDATAKQRHAALRRYRAGLDHALTGRPHDAHVEWPGLFETLAEQVERHALSPRWLHALLDAFVQDVDQPLYRNRSHLLDYCARSANPVGRLLLELYRVDDPISHQQSDAICSGLQLVNFWQDLSVDLRRGRVYLPMDDAQRHGLTLDHPQALNDSSASQGLVRDLCAWADDLLNQGAPLALRLPGRIGWELRLVVQGAIRVLAKIAAMQYRTLSARPRLRAPDLPPLAWRAWRMSTSAH